MTKDKKEYIKDILQLNPDYNIDDLKRQRWSVLKQTFIMEARARLPY